MMKTAVIISLKDLAGVTIKESLIEQGFKKTENTFDGNPVYEMESAKLYTLNEDTVYSENIDKKIEADIMIFATRHQSESGKPVLSFHTPGNWNKAGFGGKERTLCISPARHLKLAMEKLAEYTKDTGYEVSCEQTHHGPYTEIPTMFIEIGSSEEQWKDKDAAGIIAKTIIDLIRIGENAYANNDSAVFFGGGHYNPGANRIMQETGYLIGHVCAKYNFEDLTEDIVKQAFEKQLPKPTLAILDWKGLGQGKQHLLSILENLNIRYIRSKEATRKD